MGENPAGTAKEFGKGSLWNVEVLLSRAIGKPKETATIETEAQKQIVVVYGEGAGNRTTGPRTGPNEILRE